MQTPGDHSTMQLVEDYSVRFVLRTVGEPERESSLIGEIRAGSCSNLQPFQSSCILRSGIPSTAWGKWSIRCHIRYAGSVSRFRVSIVFCSSLHFGSGPSVSLRHNSGFCTGSVKVSVIVSTMKRPRKRSRSGERPCPSARPQPTPLLTNINLTSSPEDPPASNPTRHPILNSAFQSTHFKFQSNLNRPLISAQITILMTEEINEVSPISCIDPNSSHNSERSSAKIAMAPKREAEPVIQVDSPSLIPPMSDSINLILDPDAGTTDRTQEGNVLNEKEVLSQDDACQQAEETQGKRKYEQVPEFAFFGSWMLLRKHCPVLSSYLLRRMFVSWSRVPSSGHMLIFSTLSQYLCNAN